MEQKSGARSCSKEPELRAESRSRSREPEQNKNMSRSREPEQKAGDWSRKLVAGKKEPEAQQGAGAKVTKMVIYTFYHIFLLNVHTLFVTIND